MGFMNKYPYTDFHELNLDWFLEEFKKVTDKVTTLEETVQQFTEFVTNYFDNLDVQQEINNKLDAMAEDGTLAALIEPLFDDYKQTIDDTMDNQNNRLTVLEGRMDEFASLPPGSTAGNAELLDIRVSNIGITYPAAGDATRGMADLADERTDVVSYKAFAKDYDRPYPLRAALQFKPCTVGANDDTWLTNGPRIVARIPDEYIDGDIFVYITHNVQWAIYSRLKSDGSYVGYVQNYSRYAFFTFTPDTVNYSYHFVCATDDNSDFTAAMIEDVERGTNVFSGTYDLSKPEAVSTNLVNPALMTIGGYFYGQQNVAANPNMAYTDFIPVKENHTYYVPYMTLGYSTFDGKQIVNGGNYAAVEGIYNQTTPNIAIAIPAGTEYIRLSVRNGDINNLVFSEIPFTDYEGFGALRDRVVKRSLKSEKLNYLYNEKFDQSTAPSRFNIVGTLNGDHYELTGPINAYGFDMTTMDKMRISLKFAIPTGTPDFTFGFTAYYLGFTLADSGIAVKVSGNTAEIRRGAGTGGTYATLLKTVDLTPLNITSGEVYMISIEKDTINKQIVKICKAYAPSVIIEETIDAIPDPNDDTFYTDQCRCWGPGILFVTSGRVDVYEFTNVSLAPTYPKIAFYGDSYIECFGRNPLCGYANLVKAKLKGNVFLSGLGGDTTMTGITRLGVEIRTNAAEYVVLGFGVNDSFSVALSDYKTKLLAMIDIVKASGATPILVTIPRCFSGGSDNLSYIQAANPWVKSLGYDYIDIAAALSTGDGETQDTTKYVSDLTHTNKKGAECIYQYIESNLEYLLFE